MPSPLHKPTVLVVDDDSAFLDLINICLQKEFAVTSTTSPVEGLAAFGRQSFDVVVVDRAMPEMPGPVFASKIKEQAPEMPLILIFRICGATPFDPVLFDTFLPKPFTRKQLIDAVKALLPKSGLEAAGSAALANAS